jgi:hypothetical protein
MNFDFSEDQKALQAEARRFLVANCPIERVRAVLDDPTTTFDATLWRAVGEQGWLGAAISESHGGLGLGHLELCGLAYELGRALAPIPFASTAYILAEALELAGDDAQKARLLPQIAEGKLIGALATAEGPGAVDASRLQTEVREGRLWGEKAPVTDGDIADVALVLALEDGRPGVFLADLNGQGVERTLLRTLDPTRDAAKLVFAGAPAERLGPSGWGEGLLAGILDRAAVLVAFEQCGGADRCLEMARDYALDRYAFGRVIGSYQALKHKLADIFVKNELARSNAYYGAWALNAQASELPIAASAARIAATEAYWHASKENIHAHGGVGFTWEVDCHLFYRRSRQLGLWLGAPRLWKQRLTNHLELGEPA